MVNNAEYVDELLEITQGMRGVPVIVVGDQFMRGFDEAKLSALVGLKR